jgi:hypothetical protein
MFIAITDTTTAPVVYSYDGINWIKAPQPIPISPDYVATQILSRKLLPYEEAKQIGFKSGSVTSSASAATSVTFLGSYTTAPQVFLQIQAASAAGATAIVATVTTTGFTFNAYNSSAARTAYTVYWMATD